MARWAPVSDGPTPVAPTCLAKSSIAATSSSSKITKTRSERSNSRSTRKRARMLSSASSFDVLQDVVDEAHDSPVGANSTIGAGKGKAKARAVPLPDDDMGTAHDFFDLPEEEVYFVPNKSEKPFRIMDLPAEIRLEIYRACLTRPYNILLSKREQQQQCELDADEQADKDTGFSDSQSDADDTDDDNAQFQVRRSARQQRYATTGSTFRRSAFASGLRGMASRGTRPVRLLASRSASTPATNHNNHNNGTSSNGQPNAVSTTGLQTTNNPLLFRSSTSRLRQHALNSRTTLLAANEPPRNQSEDPLIVNILRASKEIYKEARGILYSENLFTLDLNTAMPTLACLHQRSRRHIKHVELEIPTYNEILERFQETVRLSLRYCSGLKKFVIHMPFTLPGADGSGTTGNTTVYANGFDILRWLPQECNVLLKGNICIEIETVVNKHLQLAKTLDKLAYARRQLISNDTGPSAATTNATANQS